MSVLDGQGEQRTKDDGVFLRVGDQFKYLSFRGLHILFHCRRNDTESMLTVFNGRKKSDIMDLLTVCTEVVEKQEFFLLNEKQRCGCMCLMVCTERGKRRYEHVNSLYRKGNSLWTC